MVTSFAILCSLILFFSASTAENPVTITSGSCEYLQTTSNNYRYRFSISWKSTRGDKLFLSYIDPSCLIQTNWCKAGCTDFKTMEVTYAYGYFSQTQDVPSYRVSNGYTPLAVLHSENNICSWAKRYDPQFFKSTKNLVCPNVPAPAPTTPTRAPTPYSYTPRPDYSLLSLLLLLLPLLIFILIAKRIREAYINRVAANEQHHVTETNINNGVPLYDMATLPVTQVQIFPEYPMMNSNQFQGIDPTQTLTPVYTQTYSQPGIQ